jgi:hypothetical protein
MLIDWAGTAEQTGLSFTANAGLRAFGLWGEKQFGATFAHRIIHPVC